MMMLITQKNYSLFFWIDKRALNPNFVVSPWLGWESDNRSKPPSSSSRPTARMVAEKPGSG